MDRFTSLDQTRSFTFIGLTDDTYCDPDYPLRCMFRCSFGRTRSTNVYPIRLDRLEAHFAPDLRDDPRPSGGHAAHEVTSDILSLFSPTSAVLSSTYQPDHKEVLWVGLETANWTSLTHLSVSEIGWYDYLSQTSFFASLPSGSVTVTVDLSNPESAQVMLRDLVFELIPDEDDEGVQRVELLSPAWPQVKELVVKIHSTAQKAELIGDLHEVWDEYDGPSEAEQGERERREAMIRFVLV